MLHVIFACHCVNVLFHSAGYIFQKSVYDTWYYSSVLDVSMPLSFLLPVRIFGGYAVGYITDGLNVLQFVCNFSFGDINKCEFTAAFFSSLRKLSF